MRFLSICVGAWLASGGANAFVGGGANTGPYVGGDGWTVLTPSTGTGACGGSSANYTGTCIYYVSNGGTDDTTNCKGYPPPITTTPTTTCASLAFAMTQTRTRGADWILHKGGQTFLPVAAAGMFGKGKSRWEPLVVGTYDLAGAGRATVDFIDNPIADPCAYMYTSGDPPQFVAVVDLVFTNSGRDPDHANFSNASLGSYCGGAFSGKSPLGWALFENNVFEYSGAVGFSAGNGLSPAISGRLMFRRNVVRYNYPSRNTGLSITPSWTDRNDVATNGILAFMFEELIVEENIFYQVSQMPSFTSGGTVTISIASPAVVTWTDTSALPPAGIPPEGSIIGLNTTGALPTGIVNNTGGCRNQQCYYLRNVSGNTANISTVKTGGSLVNTSGSQSGTHTAYWVDPESTTYVHNLYIDLGFDAATMATPTLPITFRNNISSKASATSIQSRPGGIIYNNFMSGSPVAVTCCGWPSTITYNVILNGVDTQYAIAPTTDGAGNGIVIESFKCAAVVRPPTCTQEAIDAGPVPGAAGTVVQHNVVANRSAAGKAGYAGIYLGVGGNTGLPGGWETPAVTGVTVTDNVVCGWATTGGTPSGSQISDASGTGGNTVSGNTTSQAANGDCSGLGLPDPTLDAGDYYATIGGAPGSTTDDFILAAMAAMAAASAKTSPWDVRFTASAVNDWLRTNAFGVANP